MKRLLCLFSILLFQNSLFAQENLTYVDQDQHTAFHVFSNGHTSLISHCNTDWPEDTGQCYFDFKDDDKKLSNILVRYTDLEEIHVTLLSELKEFRIKWREDHPVNIINQYIFLFRQNDLDTLDSIIEKLEEETLSNRVLMARQSRGSDQFFSQELSEAVIDIYSRALMPFETRNL